MSRFDVPRSMHNTSEIVKLRRVIERIEKLLEDDKGRIQQTK